MSVVPYDPAAYTMNDEDGEGEDDENWEDAESEIEYPVIPSSPLEVSEFPGPSINTFSAKAKEHNRRESKEFKSIFTVLEHPSRSRYPTTLTHVNTKVNMVDPTKYVNTVTRPLGNPNMSKTSPSTIRHVRTSGVTDLVQPFEDIIKTVPHGLPGKKRRLETNLDDDNHWAGEDAKENRRLPVMPQVPGRWEDTILKEDEGEKRGGKRFRLDTSEPKPLKVEAKKPNAAREAAAKNAKERKGKGVLSLSRLNMLARPKERK